MFKRLVLVLLLLCATPLIAQPAPLMSGAENLERRDLGNGLAAYTFDVRVGPGEYDIIGLHRVVKERFPGVPERRLPGVFMVHGDAWDFEGAFFSGPNSIVSFLAENGLDVWGIDQRWTRVPAGLSDYSFLSDWGLELAAGDLGVGLVAARIVRTFTGSGPGKLFLAGWSRGGLVGYTYLNAESQLPRKLRQVRGFLPIDIYLKTDDPSFTADGCTRRDIFQDLLDTGAYDDTVGQLTVPVGQLAQIDPTGASPIFPGLDNRQASLVLGAATFTILPGGLGPVPVYHFLGGSFDSTGNPVALNYSDENTWNKFLQGAYPVGPNRIIFDTEQSICGEVDVPFDDHLDDIDVPVFYVGAGGGFGDFGIYTTTLLGSTDVTSLVVSLDPDRLPDFGHGDLFLADQAKSLVWQPILDWILSR